MSKVERPFPPARDFDLSQSKRVRVDFDINEEIPLPFRNLVNFLKSQPDWVMDVGKTMVVLYEQNNQADHGAAVRLSWFGEENRIALDLIPVRTETMDFARRDIGESVPGQYRMYMVSNTAFGGDPTRFVSFESVRDSSTATIGSAITLNLDSGSVSIENKYTPKPKNNYYTKKHPPSV